MVYVMLADGFEEIEALAFTDILRRADIETKTVSTDNKGNNTGSHKITVITDCNIEQIDYDTIEAIVLPGGLPGAYNLRDNNHVVDILKFAISKKIPVGAICASPYVVLEENNLIDGLNATVNPYFSNSGEICSLTFSDNDSNLVDISNADIPLFIIGFIIMMILDVLLG